MRQHDGNPNGVVMSHSWQIKMLIMRNTLLFLLLLLPFISNSQTCEVSGNQEGTWDCDTILVVGDVMVPEGSSLTVAEGTKVVFKDYYSIMVNGDFEAVGSEDDMICFTSADTTGFYRWDSGDGGWNALIFQDMKNPLHLEYCYFSYGKAIEDLRYGGAVRIYNVDDVIIDNCIFYHNFTSGKGAAMYAEHSNLKLTNCEVDGNLGYNEDGAYMHGGGFQFVNCTVNMEDMYFHDNYCTSCYGGGVNFDSCNVVLNKAVFEDNYAVNAAGLGIQRSNHLDVRISNVLLNNNIAYHYGGAMAIATSSPLVQNVTMANNYTIAAGGGAMQFYSEARPVFKNCIIWGNDWYSQDDIFGDGAQIFIWGGDCVPEFYNSVIEGGLKEIHGNMYAMYDKETMLAVDPLFVDTVARDFQLLPTSPAINSGTIDTTGLMLPPTDLAGKPRIVGDRIDMGCFESDVTSIKEIKSHKNINIYPNPLTDNSVCSFTMNVASDVSVKVYDQRGALIYVKNYEDMQPGINVISLSDLMKLLPGNKELYFISIETLEEMFNAKIVY